MVCERICLTGTIVPNTVMVQRSDVNVRLKDYKCSIEFYLSETDLPVFFLENSDYDLEKDPEFQAYLETNRFFVQRFEAHPDAEKGKGFQEFYMLDQFFATDKAQGCTAKISGRYIIRNINNLLLPSAHPMQIDLHRKMKVAITGFFVVENDFYRKELTGIYVRANDGEHRYIEHVLYDSLRHPRLKSQVALLPENPEYEGISGSHGASMHRNPYKMKIRQAERKLSRAAGIHQFLFEY